jgi:hypothetical protein
MIDWATPVVDQGDYYEGPVKEWGNLTVPKGRGLGRGSNFERLSVNKRTASDAGAELGMQLGVDLACSMLKEFWPTYLNGLPGVS